MEFLGYTILKNPTRWGQEVSPSAMGAVDVAVSHMWQELAQLVPGFEPPSGEDAVLGYVDAVVAGVMAHGTSPSK